MAFNSLSEGVPTLVENLHAQNKIPNKAFSFYFDLGDQGEPRSELVLGGHDPAYMDEDFTFVPVVSPTYWTIEYEGLKFGDTPIEMAPNAFGQRPQKALAMIDTGGSL